MCESVGQQQLQHSGASQDWQNDEESQAALAASIREAIKLLFFKKFEVPVLAMFHKELMGELLCTRAREISDVVSVSCPLQLAWIMPYKVAYADAS